MKRLGFFLILCGILASSVFSAGSSQPSGSSAAPAPQASAAGDITVRLLTDATGIDDKSYNADAKKIPNFPQDLHAIDD